jgi:hypothetical protein
MTRRRRRRKGGQCAILCGPHPLKNTLSEEEETEENSIPNIKETVSFPCLRSSSLSFASLFERTRSTRRRRRRRRE